MEINKLKNVDFWEWIPVENLYHNTLKSQVDFIKVHVFTLRICNFVTTDLDM